MPDLATLWFDGEKPVIEIAYDDTPVDFEFEVGDISGWYSSRNPPTGERQRAEVRQWMIGINRMISILSGHANELQRLLDLNQSEEIGHA